MRLSSFLLSRIGIGLGLLFSAGSTAHAQLVLHQTAPTLNLVGIFLLDPDVEFSNVLFNGVDGAQVPPEMLAHGEVGRFNGANTALGLASGVFLCTNDASTHLTGPNTMLMENGGGLPFSPTPDIDLSQLSGHPNWEIIDNIYSKSVLEFDFVAHNDMVEFRYVFSSEEYERWACSQYNDVFGMLISGPGISGPFTNDAMNIAFVPGSLSTVSVNTVNSGAVPNNMNGPWDGEPFEYCETADPNWLSNTPYYRYNGGQWPSPFPIGGVAQLEEPYNNDPYYLQHNGMTVVLTASAALQIGETYRMKMALGNVGDWRYPAAVFLQSNSFRCADRFSLTVDEGANVDLSGPTPVIHRSDADNVSLRFNRWGGFYLDEDLQITVEGDAVAGEDYTPALPASIHFDQLDSSAAITLNMPEGTDTTRELIINLVTSNGDKVQAFPLIIEQPPISTGMASIGVIEGLSVFPNPAEDVLNIVLPYGLKGRTELEVLDPSGRMVKRQVLSGAAKAIIDLGGLPNGLYTVKAMANGCMATARISVRR